MLDKIEVDSSDEVESFITQLLGDVISPSPIWRSPLIALLGAMTHRLLRCGRLANEEIGPICLPMSFNERADKQRVGGAGLRPFIITSPMINLFHPVYQINITRHGLDDLQSHLISLDTATEGGREAFIQGGVAEQLGEVK